MLANIAQLCEHKHEDWCDAMMIQFTFTSLNKKKKKDLREPLKLAMMINKRGDAFGHWQLGGEVTIMLMDWVTQTCLIHVLFA